MDFSWLPSRYSVVERFEQRGVCSIFKVFDTSKKRDAILRVLETASNAPSARFSFIRSYAKMSSLDLPFVVSLGPLNEARGRLFFTSELVSGLSVGRAVFGKRNDVAKALSLLSDALYQLHSRGEFHGNLKPSNVIYEPRLGRVVLLDLGFFGYERDTRWGPEAKTAVYSAPEMRCVECADLRSDFWGLGLIVLEALTGLVIGREVRRRLLTSEREAAARWIKGHARGLDARLLELVLSLASPDPLARPQSSEEVVQRVHLALGRKQRKLFPAARPDFTLSPRLVGRQELLSELAQLREEARKRGLGVAVVLGGPGMGKTRLCEEFRANCAAKGIPFSHIACGPSPLYPYRRIVTLLESFAAWSSPAHREELLQAADGLRAELSRGYRAATGKRAKVARQPESAGCGAWYSRALDALWGTIRDEFSVLILDNADDILSETAALLRDLSQRQAEFQESGRRAKGGLFLVMTIRRKDEPPRPPSVEFDAAPPGPLEELRRCAYAVELNLEPLSEEDSGRLIQSVLGSRAVPPALCSSLYERFGGNPGWLIAAVRLFCWRKKIATPLSSADTVRLEKAGETGGYRTAQQVFRAIVRRQPDRPRQILHVMSLLPAPTPLSLLAAIIGCSVQELVPIMDHLCRIGILMQIPDPLEVLFDYRHRVVRSVCEGSIPSQQSTEVHKKAARFWKDRLSEDAALARARLIYHQARASRGQKAAKNFERLAQNFKRVGTYQRAVEFLTAAIEALLASPSQRKSPQLLRYAAGLHRLRGDLLMMLSEYAAAESDYSRARAQAVRAKSKSDECICLMRMAELHRLKGDIAGAIKQLEEAKAIAEVNNDAKNEAAAAHALGRAYWHQGRLDIALERFKTALQSATRRGDERECAAINHNIGSVFWGRCEYDRAMHYFRLARQMWERSGDRHLATLVLNSIGSVNLQQGRLSEAMDDFKEALSFTQRVGDRRNASTVLANIAWIECLKGEVGPALDKIDRAVSIKRQIGDMRGLAGSLITRGEILREAGDIDGAFSSHYEAYYLLWKGGEPTIANAAQLQIGLDHLAQDNSQAALLCLEGLTNRGSQIGKSLWAQSMQGLAMVHLRRGDYQDARRLCTEALALLGEVGKPLEEGLCCLTLARAFMRGGQLDRASEPLERAASLIDPMGVPSAQFSLYWALGEYHQRQGNLSECYASLSMASSLLEGIQASLTEKNRNLLVKRADVAEFLTLLNSIRHDLRKEDTQQEELGAVQSAAIEGPDGSVLPLVSPLPKVSEVCDAILSPVMLATPLDRGCIWINAENGRFRAVYAKRRDGRVVDPETIPNLLPLVRRVALTGAPVSVPGGHRKEAWMNNLKSEGSIICVPLVGKHGRLGAAYFDTPENITEHEDHVVKALTSMAKLAGALIENHILRQRQQAYIQELVHRTTLLAGAQSVLPKVISTLKVRREPKVPFSEIVGKSEKLLRVLREAAKVVKTDVTVLITGETGTGKELLARAIHKRSHRKDGPFVVINCGAIPRELVEAELFGFEKGAFTGAHKQKRGRLEFGDKGTIFLDEIAELSLDVQVKLLRFLETKTIERVGGTSNIRIDCRIIAATNRNLTTAVADGSFREDLYYRLSLIHLHLPPIRDRDDDVLHLANHFLQLAKAKYAKKKKIFSVDAIEKMLNYSWPGNVRELQNRVEKGVIISSGNTITAEDLGLAQKVQHSAKRLKDLKDQVEASRVRTALKVARGRVSQAARIVGVSRQNLYRLTKKHGIQLEEYRPKEGS